MARLAIEHQHGFEHVTVARAVERLNCFSISARDGRTGFRSERGASGVAQRAPLLVIAEYSGTSCGTPSPRADGRGRQGAPNTPLGLLARAGSSRRPRVVARRGPNTPAGAD